MMTKKMMRMLTTLALVTTLTACSRSGTRTYDSDRSDKNYRAAMADYSAGRLEAARKGFERAILENPINAAARFQLACLMQDRLNDPLAAYVEYQAFLRLDPNGEKSQIAAERSRLCLKFYLTSQLKDAAGRDAEFAEELRKITQESADRRTKIVGLEKDLQEARETIVTITRENDRLRSLLEGLSVDKENARKTVSREVELFGSDKEEARLDIMDEANDLARIAKAEDAVNGTESSLLPKQAPDAKAKRDEKKQAEREAKDAKRAGAIQHPETYTIQDGDTLYRLAQRFYGRRSAWEKIREANKEKISNDCKLRVGDVIKLP